MASGRYDFLFFNASAPIGAEEWAAFALDQVRSHGLSPAFISGKKSGWVRAPKDPAELGKKLLAAALPGVQAGTNPHHDDPYDGWGISIGMSGALDYSLARYCEPGGERSTLLEWARECAGKLSALAPLEYAYGYSGEFPKDGVFGYGMTSGKPSASLRPLFGDPGRLEKWFRARMWRTTAGYVFDMFPVNVLRDTFLDQAPSGKPLRATLATFGRIEPVGNGLSLLSFDDEEGRASASSFLESVDCVVAAHADGQWSQVRTAR